MNYEWLDAERKRQDDKWGEQNHDDLFWLAILSEEVGETGKAILESGDIRKEVEQVAAVAVAWVECRERRAALAAQEDDKE